MSRLPTNVIDAISEVVRLRKILNDGRDDEGRKVSDPHLMRICIDDAVWNVGKLVVDYHLNRPTLSDFVQ